MADLTDRQLMAMFGRALSQSAPSLEHKAICVGFQNLGERAMRDAPAFIIQQLSGSTGAQVVGASECTMDTVPRLAATGAQAILYTVKVERVDDGVVTFIAMATFGNLGAKGTEYRLRALPGGAYVAEPSGLTILS